MSISTQSNSDRVASPVARYLTWSGERGCFTYWDNEAKQNVDIEQIDFIFLDRAASISGWNDATESKIYSNLVKNVTKQKFTVKESKGNKVLAEGFYKDIKCDIFNYTTNVFVYSGGELVCLQVKKSGLAAWSSFVEETGISSLYNSMISATKSELNTKGRVKYYSPVFTTSDVSEEDLATAIDLDTDSLQPYLNQFNVDETEA